MNKKLWVGIYVVSFVLFVAALLVGPFIYLILYDYGLGAIIGIGLLVVSSLMYLQFVIVQTIYTFKMLSRMWGSIQDGVTPITVGKAIGFLFIPVFSIYWIFVAWGSFPKHYNNYIDRHKLNVPHLSSGVYIAMPILMLTGIFILPILVMPIVFAGLIAKTCDAVNQLKQAEEARRNNVQQPAWEEQAPKMKHIFAALGGLAVVLVLFLTAFSVFAYRNMNPTAKGDETPETVGKFKRGYSGVRGSIFGLRKEFYANYKLADGSKKEDGIRYDLTEYWREADAVSEFNQPWDYCSEKGTKKEGAIKDKSGNQVGEFRICDDKVFYARAGNKYISLGDKYSKSSFGSDDLIQFFMNLPFNTQIDAASFSAVNTVQPSSSPTLSNTKTDDRKSTVASTDTADFVLTAAEFHKESDGANSTKNKEKYADKIVEISGRVYRTNFGGGGDVALTADKNTLSLKIADESRADADKLKTDERVVFKCRSGGSYRIELKSCLLTEAKGIISPDDKPDFTFTAKDFFKEVDGNQSVESAMKKHDKYASKIIELTGRVRIMGKPHYLFVAEMEWVSCKPDEENAGQFANLREGQEVKFKGLGSRYSAGLEHCIVISQ